MHLFVIARGIKGELERWQNDLLAKYFPYKAKTASGGVVNTHIQLSVRPIQLFDIVYPKEVHKEVLRMVHPYEKNKLAGWLRRLMKLDPVKFKVDKFPPGHPMAIHAPYVGVIAIGTKDDRDEKVRVEML